MSDVFVSYKAEDRRRVRPLVEALQSDGYSVWWDEQIGGGSSWRQEIENELNAARCVIVVWSKRSVGPDGEFVQDEAARAKERRVYVPVTIDKVHLPLGFGETQALPLAGWHGARSDARYQAVLAAVRKNAGSQGPLPVTRQPGIARRTVIAGGAVVAVAAAGGGIWSLLRSGNADTPSSSIAVLPFENFSGDPSQVYFSDGLAEELRSALARIPQLKVVARTSSEAVRNDDARAAAQKLGVANILTGSVRRSPQLIRVDAQLVDGHTGLERWSQTFDRPLGDVLEIQTNIAENVADALSIQLVGPSKAALTLGGTTNPAAQDLFLQADRGTGTPEGILHTIAQLDAAIQLDPNYAQAYAGKALALSSYGATYARTTAEKASFLDQATAAAKRAIQIAPKLPEGHTALAFAYRNLLRLKDSDREIGIAVSLPGAAATTWSSYGVSLVQKSREQEALHAISRATQLDPLNPAVFATKAWTLSAMHQFPAAIDAAQQALRIAPSLPSARRYLIYSLIMMRRFDEATAELSKLPTDNVQAQAARAIIAAAKGDLKTSDRLIAEMQRVNGDTANYQYAEVYAQRHDADAAIRFLNKSLEARDPGLPSMRVDPLLDPIRSDPRFAEIVRKIDLSA